MFKETGVDGIMCGRGTFGNPWLFEKIINYLKTGEKLKDVSKEEKFKVILKHIELEVDEHGENVAIKEMRKHLAWYVKNMPNSSKIRVMINKLETKNELIDCLREYFESI